MENLDDILGKLLSSISEAKAVAIVSKEGLPITSALAQDIDETRISGMTAALLSLAKTSVIEMKMGKFEQLVIKESEGYLLVLPFGSNMALIISTTKSVRLGLIFLDIKRNLGDFDYYTLPFPFVPPGSPGAAGSATKKNTRSWED